MQNQSYRKIAFDTQLKTALVMFYFVFLDAKDCPKNWRGTCKKFGNFGECLGDPLIRLGNGECKCYKGYYDHFPKGCIGKARLCELSHPSL